MQEDPAHQLHVEGPQAQRARAASRQLAKASGSRSSRLSPRQAALAASMEADITPRMQAGLDNERRAFLAATMLERLGAAEISEDAIEAAFAARYADAAAQTEYNASHILVETREAAEDLLSELANGAEFAELARDRSIGPTAARGGNLGWFGRGMMVAPFEEAVVALRPGEVSEPVQTQFGWHVITLNDTRNAAPPALEDVRAELVDELRRQQIETAVADLVEQAGVTMADPMPDPALIRDSTIFETGAD
jgi:peptidyl-prolyl cis-trans isomerase C